MARVVPDVTGLDKQFDYLVPDALVGRVHVGTIVRVPLHGRRVGGFVVAVGPPDPAVPLDKLKPIAKVSGVGPSPDIHDLARWASVRWAARRVRPFLVAAAPPGVVARVPVARRSSTPVPEPVHPGAQRLLTAGGGVVRLPPTSDVLPVLLAACRLGPVLAVVAGADEARVLAARLRRAGREVALLPQDWAAARGGVDVVIGARAAVWAPCTDMAAVVVIDEHDEALQEERTPTWHARDVAVERARRAGVPCLLVSPCPTVTALAWAGPRVERPAVVDERAAWPILEIVDRNREEPWQTSLVSGPLIRHLRDPDTTVVCVLNTTGRARLLACRSCAALQRCSACEAAVALVDDVRLVCGRCQTERPVVCQACGSTAMKTLRPGVNRLREELEAAAGRPVATVTGSTADPVPEAPIHVGTEAVLHRIPHADVVAFLDLDAELLAPRYRAAEQAMTLLVRGARLVGPRSTGGRVLVQTFLPRHEVIQAALLADPGRLATHEAATRAALRFPPSAALAVLEGPAADDLAANLRALGVVEVAGPASGSYLVRAGDWDTLGRAFADVAYPTGGRVRVSVDPPRR